MASGQGDDSIPLINEELRVKISEEVGKALEATLPGFLEGIQASILTAVDEKFNELDAKFNEMKESLAQERDRGKEKKACSYNKFMACKPPAFNGEVDPIICQRWINDIEGIFERSHCDPNDFVSYGTGQLRNQAKDWWDVIKVKNGIEAIRTMTWEEFKVHFLKHHSPKAVVNKIKE